MEPDDEVGQEIAGYRLEELIGRGGMGVVYRAEHLRLGRKVALKVVAPQIAREPKFRERFLRESRTAGSLDHPNVVPMYDAGEADGRLYIAMRFVDGLDLAALIAQEGKLDPARTARIVAQVASALDAAHEAGLVHRDVKPSNVLLPTRGAGRTEHAYLGDFGLTKRVLSESGVTGTSAFLGTIAYVAPEQIEGRPIDDKADQYSLACLVYECLTGHKPFERETDIATLYAHLRDPFPSVGEAVPAAIRGPIDAALARAAAKKPSDRYDSCGEFAEELVLVTGAGTVATSTAAVSARPRSTSARRSRRWIALGLGTAVIVVALVAGGGYLLFQGLGPSTVVTGHGVAVIDAATNQASLAATLDQVPTAIAADETAAWVIHQSADQATRIDAVSHDPATIDILGGPGAMVDGDGRVWITTVSAEQLSYIETDNWNTRDPSTQSLLFRPGGIGMADGILWVIDVQREVVVPLEADRPNVTDADQISVEQGPIAVVAGGGAAWVANRIDESLSRIEQGFPTADTIGLDFTPVALALDVDRAVLWIVSGDDDEVVSWNTLSRREIDRVAVGSGPVAVAVGSDAVWVANGGDGTVTRIDPETHAVTKTITIGGRLVGIAAVGDTVWVAVARR